MMVQDKRMITIVDAMAEFGFTERQLRYWLKTGKLRKYYQPLTRRILINADELQAKATEIVDYGDEEQEP